MHRASSVQAVSDAEREVARQLRNLDHFFSRRQRDPLPEIDGSDLDHVPQDELDALAALDDLPQITDAPASAPADEPTAQPDLPAIMDLARRHQAKRHEENRAAKYVRICEENRAFARLRYALLIKETEGRAVRSYQPTTASDPNASESPDERRRRKDAERKRAKRGSTARPVRSEEERLAHKRAQAVERQRRRREKLKSDASGGNPDYALF
ncbi:hypothetical protein [Jiella avicenniae]|uniref:Uncharacterized protein n=1 Tax=Jiella avicenniae TaxID=2907202 RepID=A0A9X1TEB6_9HYPH|nr:hypothetical protein [Jiella avicenniae]MCE7031003.1 hypothetical protein [Jiella avicenniae]